MQVWKQTKKKPKELLNKTPLPEGYDYIWEWYCDIFKGDPITYTEIEAWSKLNKIPVSAEEVQILRKLETLHKKTHARGFASDN